MEEEVRNIIPSRDLLKSPKKSHVVDSLTSRWCFQEGRFGCLSSLLGVLLPFTSPSPHPMGGAAFLPFWKVLLLPLSHSLWVVLLSPHHPLLSFWSVGACSMYVDTSIKSIYYGQNMEDKEGSCTTQGKKAAPPKREEEESNTSQKKGGRSLLWGCATSAPCGRCCFASPSSLAWCCCHPSFFCAACGLSPVCFPPLFFVGCCCVFPRSFSWRWCSHLSFWIELLSPLAQCGLPSLWEWYWFPPPPSMFVPIEHLHCDYTCRRGGERR